MDPRVFEALARQELIRVPPRFARRVKNVAILIEDTPSPRVCREEGLGEGETLLGLYHGIPASERGVGYSGVLPDTITLYRLPLLEEADALLHEKRVGDLESAIRLAVRETLWHELGHHFGLSEGVVEAREEAGTNRFDYAQEVIAGQPRFLYRSIMERAFSAGNLTLHMLKTITITLGLIFVLLGLLGFVSNPLVGVGALFEANAADNILHSIAGLLLLLSGIYTKNGPSA